MLKILGAIFMIIILIVVAGGMAFGYHKIYKMEERIQYLEIQNKQYERFKDLFYKKI